MSIKIFKEKELGYVLPLVVKSKEENGILINYKEAQRLNIQVAKVIGGNSMIIKRKDMEHMSGLLVRDTCNVSETGMKYLKIQVAMYSMVMKI
jgi:hypothetical protein